MIGHGGIGSYIRTTVPRVLALRPQWRFTLLGRKEELESTIGEADAHVVECTAPIYSLREQIALLTATPRLTSVFWSPHYNVPVMTRHPIAVTIHDVAHLRLREYATAARRAYAKTLFGFVRRRAAGIMFDSQFTRGEFLRLVGVPRGLEDVVPVGIDPAFQATEGARHPRTASPYFVYIGNAKPHKNLRTLLDAFAVVRSELDARLVVVGQLDSLRTADADGISRLREAQAVSHYAHVSTADLRQLLAGAVGLVVPSLYEGFGLPPLEAMASGCPAIVARAASLPEVCGDAALYFDPLDGGELARWMLRLAADSTLRTDLIERGRSRIRLYDPHVTAARVCSMLDAIVRGHTL